MPSLRDLANNVYNYNYYSGRGTFSQNNVKYPDPPVLFGSEATLMLKKQGFQWSPSNFDDGLVPFGVITRLRRAVDDTARIGKYISRTPSGLVFLIKQQALQASNPSIEYDPSTSKLKDFGPTRIYSPFPLLAQVAGNAIGSRFMRHGLLPKISNTQDYENYILKLNNDGNNRLVSLTKILSNESSTESKGRYILKYKGGPESKYGLGNTTINRYGNILLGKGVGVNGADTDNNFIRIPILNLTSITSSELGNNIDFRKYKNNAPFKKPNSPKLAESDYETKNLEKRIGIAGARPRGSNLSNLIEPGFSYDRINALSLFYEKTVQDAIDKKYDYNKNPVGGTTGYSPYMLGVQPKDLIKFRIKSISSDVGRSKEGWFMIFRAYISNIKRSVLSKWNPYNYVGRGESFYLYDGFTETITISFTIAVSSRYEMKPTYQKLNFLISSLTPSYSKDLNMIGNLHELTVGDFINQPGIITNLDLTIDADSNWEINLEGLNDMYELPHLIKCSMTFIPIYKFLPRKSPKAPYIDVDYKESRKEDPNKPSDPKYLIMDGKWLSNDMSGEVKK